VFRAPLAHATRSLTALTPRSDVVTPLGCSTHPADGANVRAAGCAQAAVSASGRARWRGVVLGMLVRWTSVDTDARLTKADRI
jgi:hypothetical protein